MYKNVILLMLIVFISYADGPSLKTGQTIVYKIGDDATYRAGIKRSYSRNEIGIVIDIVTQLEWQDNIVGNTMIWSEAQEYCTNLVLDGKGWRLPVFKELQSITDKNHFDPAVNPIFRNFTTRNIVNSDYWSSSTHALDSSYAWRIDFLDGNGFWDLKSSRKYVRCVR